jgi:prolipoprotein diacylglyceryl transferase
LSSHGGFLGVLIAVILFYRGARRQVPQMSFLNWIDLLIIPLALVSSFIRLGNFVNQEIVGKETHVPWAVIFGHPAERVPSVPRHPVQLYEAFAYFTIFLFLWILWRKKREVIPSGLLCGIGILLLGTARFILEAFKLTQQTYINQSYLEVGQLLSIPYLLFGCALCIYAFKQGKS